MAMDYKRSDRVGDLLREEIAELIQRQVKDPRLATVTICNVEISADLRHAKVFYCFSGQEQDRDSIARGLLKATGFLKSQLGKRIRLRHIPDLKFIYDTSFDYASKIDRLLRELHDHD